MQAFFRSLGVSFLRSGASRVAGCLVLGLAFSMGFPGGSPADWWPPEEVASGTDVSVSSQPLAADPTGEARAVWVQAGRIHHARRNADGWQPPEVYPSTQTAREASAAFDAAGNLHLAWTDAQGPFLEVYHAWLQGSVWTAPEQVSNGDGADSRRARLAGDARGNVHVVWTDMRDGQPEIYYSRWFPDFRGWTSDERVTSVPAVSDSGAIAVDRHDDVHLVWQDHRNAGGAEVYYRNWSWTGGWSEEVRVSFGEGSDSQCPALAVNSQRGTVHVVWHDYRGGSAGIYYRERNQDGSWDPSTEDLLLVGNGTGSLWPAVASEASDVVHVFWTDERDGGPQIYHKPRAAEWGDDRRLSSEDGEAVRASTAAGADSVVHLLWTEVQANSTHLCYRWYKAVPGPLVVSIAPSSARRDQVIDLGILGSAFLLPGSVWLESPGESPVIAGPVIQPQPDSLRCGVDLSSAAEGFWNLIVQNPDSQRVVFSSFDVDSSAWGHETLSNQCQEVWYPCIDVDAAGRPREVWACGTDDFRLYYRLEGGAEEPVADLARDAWLATQPDGTDDVFWSLQSGGQIYHRQRDPDGAWGTSHPVSQYNGEAPRGMADPVSGHRHCAWVDHRGGSPQIYCTHRYDVGPIPPAERVSAGTRACWQPTVALGPDGDLHVAWVEDFGSGNTEIQYRRWDRETEGWQTIQRLTYDPEDSFQPSLAVDPGGKAHLVWSSGESDTAQVFYTWTEGEAWSGQRISLTSFLRAPASCKYAQIDADARGNLHVAWEGDGDVYYAGRFAGEWLYERLTTHGQGVWWPMVAAGPESNADLVWLDWRSGWDQMFRRSRLERPRPRLDAVNPTWVTGFGTQDFTASGTQFYEPAVLELVRSDQNPLIGRTLLVENDRVVSRFDLTGAPPGTWSAVARCGSTSDTLPGSVRILASGLTEERVTDDPYSSRLSDNSGRALTWNTARDTLHAFWYDNADPEGAHTYEIYWTLWSADTWGAPQRLTAADGWASRNPVATTLSTGDVMVCWVDLRDGHEELYYKIYQGGAWSPDRPVLPPDNVPSLEPALDADIWGTAHLVWQEELDPSAILHGVWAGDYWGSPTQVSDSSVECRNPSVVCDGGGDTYAAWEQGSSSVFSDRWSGSGWGADHRVSDPAATSRRPSLASDRTGTVYVTWSDVRPEHEGNSEIYLQRLDTSDSNHRMTDASGASDFSMAGFSEDGTWNLVFSDARSGSPEIYYRNLVPSGGSWSLDDRFSSSFAEAARPTIPGGILPDIHVAWQDRRHGGDNYEIYALRRGGLPAAVGDSAPAALPLQIGCFPVPFDQRVRFELLLPSPWRITLQIFDAQGRRIHCLKEGELSGGRHEFEWDGRDATGKKVDSGVYFYQLTSEGSHAARCTRSGRLILVR